MRNIRRDKDEIARARLRDILEMVAPAHPCPPVEDVDHAFEMAVVMRPGLGVGVNLDGARPDLLGADAGEIDGSRAVHARRLGRVRIELITWDHLDAMGLPIDVFVPVAAHLGHPARSGLVLIWSPDSEKGVPDEARRPRPDLELLFSGRRRGRARLLQGGRARPLARVGLPGRPRLSRNARRPY